MFLILPAGVLAAMVLVQLVCARIDSRKFAAPGELITIPGAKMHVRRMGPDRIGQREDAPAVVLESGIAASTLNWCMLQPQLAEFSATCSYDRAGFGWSTTGDRAAACTLHQITENLHALLHAMDVPRPYILVAHSFGGYIVRSYAQKFSGEIAGLVLVDPLTPEEWVQASPAKLSMLHRGVWFARIGGFFAAIGLIRGPLWLLQRGNRDVPRGLLSAFGPRATQRITGLVRELSKLPPDVTRVIRALWSTPKFYWTLAGYLQSLPGAAQELDATAFPAELPVTVLSGAHNPEERLQEHAAIARHSVRGRHVIADKSAHWIHLDQPELVTEAVRELANAAKAKVLAG
jgi:pimeloyl-ACP methyl ester carboxylesterase